MTKRSNLLLFAAAAGLGLGGVVGCDSDALEAGGGASPAKPHPLAVSEVIYPAKTSKLLIGEKNFVVNWLVLGPFPFKESDFKGDEQQEATDHLFMKDEAALDGSQAAPKGATWQAKRFKPGSGEAGQIDLDALYGGADYAAAYAVGWLSCPKDLDKLKLCVGSDDYVKVWINGKNVHKYAAKRRASEWDQDIVQNVSLKKGLNRIVVKCVDVVFDWDFYLRLTDGSDKTVEFRGPQPK